MASYKVKNEAGQEFEVDEEKIGEAEKDGFLPVVTNGKEEHRVSFSDIRLAKKDGYLPKTAESFLEAKDTFFGNLNQMIPGSGLIDKAAAATNAGIQEIGDLFRDDGNKKEFKDRYQGYLDTQDTERKIMDEKYPVASTAGTVAGIVPNAMIPVPFGKAKGVIGAGQRIMANTAISAADSATRNKDEILDEDAGVEGGLLAGGISAGVESLPLVGKGAKAIKKLLPGTDDAYDLVNKSAAKLGSMIPGTSADSDEIFSLLKDTKGRREARKLYKDDKRIQKQSELLSETFKYLDDVTSDQVGELYTRAENNFLQYIKPQDRNVLAGAVYDLKGQLSLASERPELFGRAKRVLENVDQILEKGGLDEFTKKSKNNVFENILQKNDTANIPFTELNTLGQQTASITQAKRLLDARRYIDDVTKNVDFEKMLKAERDTILEARKIINSTFDSVESAGDLRKMDTFYSQFEKQSKNAFNKLETPLPAGGREFTPEKTEQFLKSEAAQAKFIERELEKFGQLMGTLDGEVYGTKISAKVSEVVKEAREVFQMARKLDELNRTSGGPSSQSINSLVQVLIGYATSGVSLLALPVTNPAGWMNLVDGVAGIKGPQAEGLKKFLNKITEGSKQVLERTPQLATRLYIENKKEDSKPINGKDLP